MAWAACLLCKIYSNMMEPSGSIHSLFLAWGKAFMTKRILLVGTETFDSGKTTLAIQLATGLINLGTSVEYYKPISAHNYLERYAHTLECLNEGKLYSYDAARLKKAMQTSRDVLLMNPVHRLYVPALERHQREETEREMGTLALAGLDSVIAMERISYASQNQIDSTFLISRDLVESGKLVIKRDEVESLVKNGRRIDITTLEELQEFEAVAIERNLTRSLNLLENEADVVIIESFNDSVWPWEGLQSVSHVISVGSKGTRLYNPERFRKAAFLKKRDNLPIREVSFGRISDLIEPTDEYPVDSKFIRSGMILESLGIGN